MSLEEFEDIFQPACIKERVSCDKTVNKMGRVFTELCKPMDFIY